MVDATLLIPPSRSFNGIVYLEQSGMSSLSLENTMCTMLKYGDSFFVKSSIQ